MMRAEVSPLGTSTSTQYIIVSRGRGRIRTLFVLRRPRRLRIHPEPSTPVILDRGNGIERHATMRPITEEYEAGHTHERTGRGESRHRCCEFSHSVAKVQFLFNLIRRDLLVDAERAKRNNLFNDHSGGTGPYHLAIQIDGMSAVSLALGG